MFRRSALELGICPRTWHGLWPSQKAVGPWSSDITELRVSRGDTGERQGRRPTEQSAWGFWHQVVTVVGCVKKGANRELLAVTPDVAQHRRQQRAQPNESYHGLLGLCSETVPNPQDSQCLPLRLLGHSRPLALLALASKATHPPKLSSPRGFTVSGGGTSCECAVSAATAQEQRSRGRACVSSWKES